MADTPVSLLDRLRDRPDSDAWQRWFDLYQPILQHWLRQAGLQLQDANDVAQEVFLAVVVELPRFLHNGRPGAFRNWLRQVLVNRLRAFFRSRLLLGADAIPNWETVLKDLEDTKSPLGSRWDNEHDQFVLRRLLVLIEPEFTPPTWQAFRRLIFDGEKADKVAESLNLTVNAVRIAKSRILSRLRDEARGLID
jgi:RNA polymerase sigma-70 factor (ECF subfamily)